MLINRGWWAVVGCFFMHDLIQLRSFMLINRGWWAVVGCFTMHDLFQQRSFMLINRTRGRGNVRRCMYYSLKSLYESL